VRREITVLSMVSGKMLGGAPKLHAELKGVGAITRSCHGVHFDWNRLDRLDALPICFPVANSRTEIPLRTLGGLPVPAAIAFGH